MKFSIGTFTSQEMPLFVHCNQFPVFLAYILANREIGQLAFWGTDAGRLLMHLSPSSKHAGTIQFHS